MPRRTAHSIKASPGRTRNEPQGLGGRPCAREQPGRVHVAIPDPERNVYGRTPIMLVRVANRLPSRYPLADNDDDVREKRIRRAQPPAVGDGHGAVVNDPAGKRHRAGEHGSHRRAHRDIEVDPPMAGEPRSGSERDRDWALDRSNGTANGGRGEQQGNKQHRHVEERRGWRAPGLVVRRQRRQRPRRRPHGSLLG